MMKYAQLKVLSLSRTTARSAPLQLSNYLRCRSSRVSRRLRLSVSQRILQDGQHPDDTNSSYQLQQQGVHWKGHPLLLELVR
jgi:hypothetical protein